MRRTRRRSKRAPSCEFGSSCTFPREEGGLMRFNTRSKVGVLVLAALAAGCGKKPDPATTDPTPSASAATAPSASASPSAKPSATTTVAHNPSAAPVQPLPPKKKLTPAEADKLLEGAVAEFKKPQRNCGKVT